MSFERHTSTPSPPAPPPEACGVTTVGAESLTGVELLRWRRDLLAWGGEDGAFDWLLDAVTGVSRSRLCGLNTHPEQWVQLRRSRLELAELWRQHLDTAVPLQYLVGHCFWRDFSLEVGPAVLIPRPETECMVDLALGLLGERKSLALRELLWADLGTGSGCLAMGLARALPNSHGLAVDLSLAALELARRNLEHAGLHLRVLLVEGDWWDALRPWWGGLSLVVANPPYIPSEAVNDLDPVVRDHEPHLALDGGGDGLVCLRRIALHARQALAEGGCLLVEHHHDQSQAVIDLFAQHGLDDLRFHQDLEGHRRFVSGRVFSASSSLASGEPS